MAEVLVHRVDQNFHCPGACGDRFRTNFTSTPVVDDRTGSRTLTLRYTMTLPARYASAWVNDDIIIAKPVVRVNC